MNNIRKIIGERLENARLDYRYWLSGVGFDGIIEPDFYKIEGQIEAYQDCLNLIPAPRTEADILKDFEKLGYKVLNLPDKPFIEIGKYNEEYGVWGYIVINKNEHNYCKFIMGGDFVPITMQEHKLLNELFEVWGWL